LGDIPPSERPRSLAARILARALAQPDAIAIDDGETAVTFGEMIAQASALAETLSPFAEPIGILLPLSTQYIVAIVAMLLAGKTYVPMDSGFPEKRNLRIVSHSGMTGVVVNDATVEIARGLDASVRPIVIPQPPPGQAPYVPATGAADRILTIFYTSGSTGEPKGVCHGEAGLTYDMDYFIDLVGLGPGDCHSLMFSPSVSISNRDIFGALLSGAKLAIVDLKRIGLSAALRGLREQNVTIFHCVPSAFRALFGNAQDGDGAAGDIRVVRLNGDRVTARDVALYRKAFPRSCRLALDLATTETRPYAAWFVDHETPLERPLVPVGFPRPDLHVALIDENGAAVAPGDVGEIVVASVGLSPGYWRDAALTNAQFVASVRHPGMTEYHTGDFGRLLPDGLLEFIGRRDRQIKVRGNTVNLGGIEAVIGSHPTIAEAAVIARTAGAETRPIAYYMSADASDPTEAIRDWCAGQLPAAFVPAEIIRIDALPKLATEKVDLIALERIDAEHVRSTAAAAAEVAPKGGVVANAWREILGEDAYRRDLPFAEAGGDSLQGMMLLLAIERRLDRHLPNGLLDGATRPSELAARLKALGGGSQGHADGRPTLILFPGIFGADFTMARFARKLGEHFNVVLMDYRHAGQDLLGPADRDRVFAEFDSAVEAAGSSARLWVMGNSFGSRIAVEASRRLLARGTAVEFVGVIDGPTDTAIEARNGQRAISHAFRPQLEERVALAGGLVGFAIVEATRFVANKMINRGMYARIHATVALLSRLGLKEASLEARRVAMGRARARAFKDVLASPLPMPLTLFVSTAPYSLSRHIPDLGWTAWCAALQIVELPGNHFEIVSEPMSARIVEALVESDRTRRDHAA
jgi:acyl-coenzyme A synthetase/AMP-(fatty) acid ligase/thioesterase domain-containing protein